MRIVIHNRHELLKVLDENLKEISFSSESTLGQTLFSLANAFPDELLLWCHQAYLENINLENLKQVFHHQRIMASYSVANISYLPSQIGYVEDSPFCKVNYKVAYPTWFMSSDVGGIFASVLKLLPKSLFSEKDFDYFLNSVAKLSMRNGLFCYSEPKLLNDDTGVLTPSVTTSRRKLFKFIKQHYKAQWVLFTFCCFLLFEHKFPFLSCSNSLFIPKKKLNSSGIDGLTIHSTKEVSSTNHYDVIIPTMGRKKYLYDVLMDLAAQTILPKRVIIIEQNPDLDATSELDFVYALDWPFKIVHHFIHQTGACNARNMAIKEVESEWVFMADDDIRFPENTLEDVLRFFEMYNAKAITLSCLQTGETVTQKHVGQGNSFGSGCSVVASEVVKTTFFNTSFEHGFGEDTAYGMELRNKGYDILYQPNIMLKHLKAPIGGFRNPIEQPWEAQKILTKPSPTVMLYRIKHTTQQQLLGYKILLFIKFYQLQDVKNPIAYINKMKKAWNSSVKWANKLDKR